MLFLSTILQCTGSRSICMEQRDHREGKCDLHMGCAQNTTYTPNKQTKQTASPILLLNSPAQHPNLQLAWCCCTGLHGALLCSRRRILLIPYTLPRQLSQTGFCLPSRISIFATPNNTPPVPSQHSILAEQQQKPDSYTPKPHTSLASSAAFTSGCCSSCKPLRCCSDCTNDTRPASPYRCSALQ